jgi:hypothetical protein
MKLDMLDMRAGMLHNCTCQLNVRRSKPFRFVNQPEASHHRAADAKRNKEQIINTHRQLMRRLLGHDEDIALACMRLPKDVPNAGLID